VKAHASSLDEYVDDARVAQPCIVDVPGMPGEVNLALCTASPEVNAAAACSASAPTIVMILRQAASLEHHPRRMIFG
jgi:hypothetical protein